MKFFIQIFMIIFLCFVLTSKADRATAEVKKTRKISLKEATVLAIKNNRKISIAKSKAAQSSHKLDTSYRNLFPTISGNLSAATHKDRLPLEDESLPSEVPRERNEYIGSIVINQNIFAGFKNSSGIKRARSQKSVNFLELKKTTNKVLFETIQAYYELEVEKLELVAENEVHILRVKQLKDINNKFAQGRSTKLEILKAQYAVKAQELTILSLKNQLVSKKLELVTKIGLKSAENFDIVGGLLQVNELLSKTKLMPIEDAYQLILQQNYDLKIKNISREIVKYGVTESVSKHFPKIDLNLTAATKSNYKNNVGNQNNQSVTGKIQLTIPLMTGLSSFSERKESAETLVQLRQETLAQKEELLEQLNNIYRDFELQTFKIDANQSNIKLINETVKQAEKLFKNGRATITDVLDAYSHKLKIQKNRSVNIYNRIMTYLKFKMLIGQRPI